MIEQMDKKENEDNRIKILITSAVVLSLFILAGVYLYRTYFQGKETTHKQEVVEEPQDKNANRKTFKTEYGFEFKQPADFEISEETAEERAKVIRESSDVTPEMGDLIVKYYLNYGVVFSVNKASSSLGNFIQKNISEISSTKLEEIKINGFEGYKKEDENGLVSYILQVGDKILETSFLEIPDSKDISEYNQFVNDLVYSIKEIG